MGCNGTLETRRLLGHVSSRFREWLGWRFGYFAFSLFGYSPHGATIEFAFSEGRQHRGRREDCLGICGLKACSVRDFGGTRWVSERLKHWKSFKFMFSKSLALRFCRLYAPEPLQGSSRRFACSCHALGPLNALCVSSSCRVPHCQRVPAKRDTCIVSPTFSPAARQHP